MGREVRRVPADWRHPRFDSTGPYKALLPGEDYDIRATAFMEMANAEGLQEAVDSYGCVDKNDYMPNWPESERTHYMMYENTSEGTPISPAFETPEELAQWLVENKVSAFANSTGSYDGWLRVARGGWAPSMVVSADGVVAGVDAF